MTKREVVFLRASLGIGGGERWAIDAARALAQGGWRVRRVVVEADARAFPDLNDGLEPAETPYAPGPILSDRLRSLRSIVRMRRLARAWAATGARPEAIILDGLPQVVPLLRRLWPEATVLMYCHFPDGLIARGGGGWVRRLYRRWLDEGEARGLMACDGVAVNSTFTAGAVRTFSNGRVEPVVIYPGVRWPGEAPAWPEVEATRGLRVITVGRFDPDKRLDFALGAWATAAARVGAEKFAGWRLTIAGGCDMRRPASRGVRAELERRIAEASWGRTVRLRPEPSAEVLEQEFAGAHGLLHPMPGEHFGIVPVEAMARGRPVLAVQGAGPNETVVDGVTGALRPMSAEAFAEVLAEWAERPERLRALGAAARERAAEFSVEKFAARWVAWVNAAVEKRAGAG
jgi:Glycosyltransferase